MYNYKLPKFAELVSNAEINLSIAIQQKRMDHNIINKLKEKYYIKL